MNKQRIANFVTSTTASVQYLNGRWVTYSAAKPKIEMLSRFAHRTAGGHMGMTLVFNDNASIDQFLADPEPELRRVRTLVHLARPYSQSTVVTMPQAVAQAHLQFGTITPDGDVSDPFAAFANSTVKTPEWSFITQPLFAGHSLCWKDATDGANGTYRFVNQLARQDAALTAAARRQQNLLKPYRVEAVFTDDAVRLTNLSADDASELEAFGSVLLVTDDDSIPGLTGWFRDGEMSNRFGSWAHIKRTMGATLYGTGAPEVFRCCEPNQPQHGLSTRAMPLDVLTAGMS